MLSSLLRLLIQIDNLFIAVVDCLQDQFVQMCTFLKNRNCRVVMAGDCQPVGTAAFSQVGIGHTTQVRHIPPEFRVDNVLLDRHSLLIKQQPILLVACRFIAVSLINHPS